MTSKACPIRKDWGSADRHWGPASGRTGQIAAQRAAAAALRRVATRKRKNASESGQGSQSSSGDPCPSNLLRLHETHLAERREDFKKKSPKREKSASSAARDLRQHAESWMFTKATPDLAPLRCSKNKETTPKEGRRLTTTDHVNLRRE